MLRNAMLAACVCSIQSQAQWTTVPIVLPEDNWPDLQHNLGSGIMTGPGVGFWNESVYLSPSSGSYYGLYYTESEWVAAQLVASAGGEIGGGCCSAEIWEAYPPETVFYRHFGGGPPGSLYSITRQDGASLYHGYSLTGSPSAIEPLDDTTCILAILTPGGVLITRNTPSDVVVLDTIGPLGSNVKEITFNGSDHGALLFDTGQGRREVRITQNGGADWSTSLTDSIHFFRDAIWLDDQTLWVAGDDGWVIRTIDGGDNWESIPIATTEDLLTMAGYSPDSVWVGGRAGAIYATGNAGVDWEDRSVEDSLVVDLQAFDGLVYAETLSWSSLLGYFHPRLHKYSGSWTSLPDGSDVARLETWWAYGQDGIILRLNGAERVLSVEIMDASGRMINAPMAGQAISFGHLRSGMYLVKLQSNQRTSVAKVIWPGQ